MTSTSTPLLCPSCAELHPLDERFCRTCGMPLVYVGAMGADQPVTEAHERARKIKPQYAEGELVRVAGSRNQPEAEFIQSLLLEEGVPSLLRRTPGFDVPEMLAAGPRDVLVPQSGYAVAREILLDAELTSTSTLQPTSPGRLLAGLFAALTVVALIVVIGTEIAG